MKTHATGFCGGFRAAGVGSQGVRRSRRLKDWDAEIDIPFAFT